MAIRGESIGTAYIKVLADGSGLPDDIERQLREADGKFEDAGSAQAKRYNKGLKEEVDHHTGKEFGKALDDAFTDALVHNDSVEKFFRSSNWARTVNNFEARFGGLGTDAAKQIEEKFRKAGGIEGIDNDIENVVARINKNVDAAINASKDAAEKARLEMIKFETNFRQTMEETDRLSKRVSSENVSNLESIRRKFEDLRLVIPNLRKEMVNLGNDVHNSANKVDRNSNVFKDLGNTMSTLADKISFGKGSRNDFLNFIGSFIVGINKAIAEIPKFIGGLLALPGAISEASKAGEGFGKALSNAFGDGSGEATAFGKLLADGPAGLAAIAAAFTVLIAILGPVAALISGIAAAITALFASLSFAVAGVLAPLVGLIAPLGIALGTVVAAFASLDVKTRKALFDRIRKGLEGIGKAARSGFTEGFGGGLDKLSSSLSVLIPLIHTTSKALGEIAANFLKGFQSKTFDRFLTAMQVFVPRALKSLSRSFENLAGAFGNLFVDLIPSTQDFLGWLEKITQEFEDWTGSVKGSKAITDFLQNAQDSLKAVGDFLGPVTRLFGTLLGSGRKSGDSIFASLGEQVDKFNTFLKENPGALASWFENGKQVAADLGNIAVALGEVFSALDSPESRRALHTILRVTDDLFKLSITLINWTTSIIAVTGFVLGGVADIARGVVHFVDKVIHALGRFQHFGEGFNPFAFLHGGGGGNISALAITGFTGWIPGAIRLLSGFARRVGPIIVGGFRAAIAPSAGVAQRVAQFFTALPGRLMTLAAGFGRAAGQWGANILARISDIPGEIIDMFRGLGARIAAAIGDVVVHFVASGPAGLIKRGLGVAGDLVGAGLPPLPGHNSSRTGPVTPSNDKTIVNNWQITTPGNDSRAVAAELLAQMVASAY